MAFSPFRMSQKKLKLVMAALVLIAMFSFIFMDAFMSTQQQGGFFSGIRRYFTEEGTLAKVNGSRIDEEGARELWEKRLSALALPGLIHERGRSAILRQAGFTPDEIELFDEALFLQQNRFAEQLIQDRQRLERIRPVIQKLSQFQKDRPNEFKAIEDSASAITLRLSGNIPSNGDPSGLVEFLHWKKQADDLGIVVSSSKVREDLNKAGAGKVPEDSFAELIGQFNKLQRQIQLRPFKADALVDQLADEIRVMLARMVIRGPNRGRVSGTLALQATPFDAWEAYVKLKTKLDVGIATIAVDDKKLLAEVPEPKPEEPQAYFEKYKNELPDPLRDTPGFKIPPLHQLQFVYVNVDPKSPLYLKEAHDYYLNQVKQWRMVLETLDPVGAFEEKLRDYYEGFPDASFPPPAAELPEKKELRPKDRFRKVTYFIAGPGIDEAAYLYTPLPIARQGLIDPLAIKKHNASELWLGIGGLVVASPVTPVGFAGLPIPLSQKTSPVEAAGRQATGFLANAAHDLLASTSGPGFAGLSNLATDHVRVGYTERYTPFEEAVKLVAEERWDNLVQLAIKRDLGHLQKLLDEYSKKHETAYSRWKRDKKTTPFQWPDLKDPFSVYLAEGPIGLIENREYFQPVADYIKQFAAKRGLVFEGMKKPRPEAKLLAAEEDNSTPMGHFLRSLFFDLELKELKRAFGGDIPKEPTAKEIEDAAIRALVGPTIMRTEDPRNPIQELAFGLYKPRSAVAPSLRGFDERLYLASITDKDYRDKFALYWKIAEQDPRVPAFDEIKDDVLKAWKHNEARALAKKQAERIIQDVVKKPNRTPDDAWKELRDLPAFADHQEISRYKVEVSATAAGERYQTAKPPEVIANPPADVITRALAELNHPGDTLIVHDRPKNHYYLLVLKSRTWPQATNTLDWDKFAFDIFAKSADAQPQIDGQRFSEFVVAEKVRDFDDNLQQLLRSMTHYNEEESKKLAEYINSRLRR